MKRFLTDNNWVFCLLLASMLGMVSCETIDELPPRSETSSGDRYKMPDPVLLDAAETELVDSIRREYNLSTSVTD